MKFWKSTLVCSVLILSLFSLITWHVLQISEEDEESYRKLMDISNSTTSLKRDEHYSARQLKEGTKKTLLMGPQEERRIGKLSSDVSTLWFSKENQSLELIEDMQVLDLLYQEEFLPDAQIVVHINADHATYFYNQEKLRAENVRIARYQVPSHTFPTELSSPFFTGTAETLSLDFGKNLSRMQAKNLKVISK